MEFNVIKTIVAIYPGRFQPFGRHHAAAFKWLESKFGDKNTYIATSNVVNPEKSPLDFTEKKEIIEKYGLGSRVVQSKNPYAPQEIMSKYDPKTTAVVFMVGEKDMKEDPRFTVGKNKSGKDSYFRKYEPGQTMKPFDQHGYLIVAPHVSYKIDGVGEMSGTNIRKALSNSSNPEQYKKAFTDIFGWYNVKIAELLKKKFALKKINESILKYLIETIVEKFDLKDKVWKDYNLSSLDDTDMKVIWNMYSNTYAKNGLDFSVHDFTELKSKYKAVYLEDVDNDGVPDAFIVYKPTEFGNKIALLGTNDKKEAKRDLLKQVFKLLKTTGWFLEASMKMEEILSQSDIPVVTDPKVIDSIAGHKGLEMMDDGYYKRKLSKVDKTIVKRMYGKPRGAKLNEQLLKEGGAAGHMAHPFDIPSVKNGNDLIKVFDKTAISLAKKPVPVKIDGINASIRLANIDGKLQFVMDRGSNKPLDVKGVTTKDLTDRFGEGHGMIKIGGKVLEIFNKAIPSIKQELGALGMLKNPNILFNIEYVEGKSNVQEYENNFLAIHNLLEIDRVSPTKRVTKEISYDKKTLDELINKLAPIAKKYGFEVMGMIPAKLTSKPNFASELSKSYSVVISKGKKETKSLHDWLSKAKNTKGLKLKLKDGKTADALSKQVFLLVREGKPINEIVADPKDSQIAIDSFVIYEATMVLGDQILKNMNSPLGNVADQEGIVVRDPSIYDKPYKITGSFIIRGLQTSFGK